MSSDSRNAYSAADPTATFLTGLRNATSHRHRLLESAPLSLALLNQNVTIAHYLQYLQAMRAIISYTEETIFPVVQAVFPDLHKRHKLHLVEHDIFYLQQKSAVSTVYLAYQPVLKQPGMAEALGFMYVMEGSTLGGKLLFKHVQQQLGLDANSGAAYFSGYGETTGAMWKAFLSMFSIYTVEHGLQEEVIEGANQAFIAIYGHFEKYMHEDQGYR